MHRKRRLRNSLTRHHRFRQNLHYTPARIHRHVRRSHLKQMTQSIVAAVLEPITNYHSLTNLPIQPRKRPACSGSGL